MRMHNDVYYTTVAQVSARAYVRLLGTLTSTKTRASYA